MKENKIIKLPSRYKNVNTTLEVLDDNRGIITTTGAFNRCIIDENAESINVNTSIRGIDFGGGPMLYTKSSLKEYGLDKQIKSIRGCYLIEFE